MKKIKQWSMKNVAKRHGYLDSTGYAKEAGRQHAVFADWIKNNFYKKKPTIVDIGCGNARILDKTIYRM